MIGRFPVVPKSVGDSCSEGTAPRSVGLLCRSGETLVGGTRWRVCVCDAGASAQPRSSARETGCAPAPHAGGEPSGREQKFLFLRGVSAGHSKACSLC